MIRRSITITHKNKAINNIKKIKNQQEKLNQINHLIISAYKMSLKRDKFT